MHSLQIKAQGTDPKKASSIFEFTANDIDGNVVGLDKYKGHVCVIVNVASKWGKTDVNYKQLVEMHKMVSFKFLNNWVSYLAVVVMGRTLESLQWCKMTF